MVSRIYVVVGPDRRYLVDATSKAQAIAHIARKTFWAHVAAQKDIVALLVEVGIESALDKTNASGAIGSKA